MFTWIFNQIGSYFEKLKLFIIISFPSLIGFHDAVVANTRLVYEKFAREAGYKPFLDISNNLQREKIVPYIDLSFQIIQNEDGIETKDNELGEEGRRQVRHVLHPPFDVTTDLSEVFTPTDELLIIKGVTGIGKTSLVRRLITQWCRNSEENNSIRCFSSATDVDMIFHLKSDQLNGILSPILSVDAKGIPQHQAPPSSLEDVFQSLFPVVFRTTSIAVMREFCKKLLIIDGFDELEASKSSSSTKRYGMSPLSFVENLVTRYDVFGFDKIILVTNMREFESLAQLLNKVALKVKFIEVKGFNKKHSSKYIEETFRQQQQQHQQQKQQQKQQQQEQHQQQPHNLLTFSSSLSNEFAELCRVPAYLSIMCELNDNWNSKNKPPETVTELLLLSLLALYQRRHSRNVNNAHHHLNPESVFDSDELLNDIKLLSRIAFTQIKAKSGKDDDTDQRVSAAAVQDLSARWNGIIRAYTSQYGMCVEYQFGHVIIQHMFCAMHLYLTAGDRLAEYLKESVFRPCWPFVFGMDHIHSSSTSCKLLKHLLEKMTNLYPRCHYWNGGNSLVNLLFVRISLKQTITLKDLEDEFELIPTEYLAHLSKDIFQLLMPKLIVNLSAIDKIYLEKMKIILEYALSVTTVDIHSFYFDWSLLREDVVDLCARLLTRSINAHIIFESMTSQQQENNTNQCFKKVFELDTNSGKDIIQWSTKKVFITNLNWYYDPRTTIADSTVLVQLPIGLFEFFLPLVKDLTLRSINGYHVEKILCASHSLDSLELDECTLNHDSSIFEQAAQIENVTIKKTVISHLYGNDNRNTVPCAVDRELKQNEDSHLTFLSCG